MIDKPKNPTFSVLSGEDSVTVKWEQIESEPEFSYKIRYKMVTDTEWTDVAVDIKKRQYVIYHLTANVWYQFRFQAINVYGKSDSLIKSIYIKGK